MGFPDIAEFPESTTTGGYVPQMAASIAALVRLFQGKAPDAESNTRLLALVLTPNRWSAGHAVFDEVRTLTLKAIDEKDEVKESQYFFEEVCAKTLYNESQPDDPFDSVSPYSVVPFAIELAKLVDVPLDSVVESMNPQSW